MLTQNGVSSQIFYLGDFTDGSKPRQYFQNKGKQFNIQRPPVFYLRIKRGLWNKIAIFFKLISNKYLFIIFFALIRPGLVVAGGDITNMNTRLMLDTCVRMGIKILMIPLTIPGPGVVNKDPQKGIQGACFIRIILKFFGLERVVFFRGWVLGSFCQLGKIALPDKQSADNLKNQGIDPKRIVNVGSILNDKISDYLSFSLKEARSFIAQSVGISMESPLITYCTEMIQSIYGEAYIEHIHEYLAKAFSALPDGVQVIIKLHPREPEDWIKKCEQVFSGERYLFIREINNYALLRASNLAIAFHSAILVEAALLDVPVLSIRTVEDGVPIRFGKISKSVHVTDESELLEKISAMLFDENFQKKHRTQIARWKRDDGIVNDGRSCDRICQLIREEI